MPDFNEMRGKTKEGRVGPERVIQRNFFCCDSLKTHTVRGYQSGIQSLFRYLQPRFDTPGFQRIILSPFAQILSLWIRFFSLPNLSMDVLACW